MDCCSSSRCCGEATIRKVSTAWSAVDTAGAIWVRLGFARMSYGVAGGLYAVGTPSPDSPVLVTANYKLTFDTLRRALEGVDALILVLDTKNVNVWCAAGKGTFGTDELVRSVEVTKLSQRVSHRKLILPQLAGPGVAAHEVTRRCGFDVVYGPVRAHDLPAFLANDMQAIPEQRRVEFPFWDRVVLTPVELRRYLPTLLICAVLLGVIPIVRHGTGVDALHGVLAAAVAWICGCLIGPAFLPWLPGRAFWIKGMAVGIIGGIPVAMTARNTIASGGLLLCVMAVASFLVMNFTGCATFTSVSGVKKEMREGIPVQVGAALLGLVLWILAYGS